MLMAPHLLVTVLWALTAMIIVGLDKSITGLRF